MSDVLARLAAPFPPDKISWRVGSTTQDKKRGMALAYIDARDVQDRLNEVCGPYWQCEHIVGNGGAKVTCRIGVKFGDEWIWRTNGAGDTDFEGEKGSYSDAFKRAAVMFGIGRYLYDVAAPWVEIEPMGRSFKIKDSEQPKLRAVLTGAVKPAEPPPAPKTPPKQEQPYTNGSTYHLVDPHDPKSSKACARGSMFLDDLEHMMAQGNAADWWAVNGSTARHIAEKHPQAAKRVAQLEAMASGGYLAAG